MDAGQVLESPLNAGPLLSGQLIHAFDHLLLFVDPVQVITQHCQTDRLKDVGVLENDTIGPWEAVIIQLCSFSTVSRYKSYIFSLCVGQLAAEGGSVP